MSTEEQPSFSPFTFAPSIPLPHDVTTPSDEVKHQFMPTDFHFDALNFSTSPKVDMTTNWVANMPIEPADLNPSYSSSDLSAGWLHHASSASSLTSLSSIAPSQSGLFVQVPSEGYISHSRHGSLSALTPFKEEPTTIYPMQSDLYVPQQAPKLELQTQGLKSNRQRSSSRVLPYDRRQRSDSISAKSEIEDEDVGALLSATTTHNTPWSASALAGGMTKMTLHHRRTSSASNTRTAPMLSRSRRSSVALRKKESMDFLSSDPAVYLHGTAEEREQAVKQDLSQRAEILHGLTSMSQKDKAKSLWVRRWLHLSYAWSEGHTVPRQGLYNSYAQSCEEHGVQAINSASFGKAVRNAFPGIKTRRLGVRGNSKYHYVSLCPAIRVEAERLNEFGDSSGQWHVAPEDGSMRFQSSGGVEIGEDVDTDEEESSPAESTSGPDLFHARPATVRPQGLRRHTTAAITQAPTTPIYDLPGFPVPSFDLQRMPSVCEFWNSFCRHQEALIACVRTLSFDRYEIHLRDFWSNLSEQDMQVCRYPAISSMIADAMAFGYNALMANLIEKLHTSLSSNVTNLLKRLADNLEEIVEQCLLSFDESFSSAKVELSVRAAHLVSRFLDLHKISTGLTPILADPSLVRAMVNAWDTIDIVGMVDQCALACGCHQDMLKGILGEFFLWLVNIDGNGVLAARRLGAWADKVVQELQLGVRGPPLPLRALVTRTGFITSQIMRDLTIRSEEAFGLFQLVKTWIDDWVAIKTLLKTALTAQSADMSQMGMTVAIPENGRGTFGDLPTAVPVVPFSQTIVTPRPALES